MAGSDATQSHGQCRNRMLLGLAAFVLIPILTVLVGL